MSIYKNINDGYSYWATWDRQYLLPHLMNKIDEYYEKLKKDGILDLWQDVENAYYNYEDGEHQGSQIKFHGPGGEIITIRSSLFKNMITHMMNGVFSQQPQFVPVAGNDDFDTKSQVLACKDALDHFYRVKDEQTVFRHTGIHSLLKGIGYTVQLWDKHQYDIRVDSYSPRRVITDLNSYKTPKWHIVVERVNKWDIAARYELKGMQIDDLTNINWKAKSQVAGAGCLFDATANNDDYIDIFHFFHDRCEALPEGRYTICCNDHTEFTSKGREVLPFRSYPVHQLIPDKILDSPYGYSPAFDLISLVKLYDAGLSTMYTELDNARTIVAIPEDSEGPTAENDNIHVLRYPTDRQHSGVQTINTYNVPPAIFETLKLTKENAMETVGQNSTTMGDSEAKSGSHAALLHTVAQQFTAPFITSFTEHIEDVGTAQITLIKDFVDDPIKLQVVGKNKQYYLKKFKKDQIEDIESTYVRAVSPMLSTPAGRLTIGQDLMKIPNSGFTAADYMMLIDTGQIDSAFTQPREHDMTLSSERDALSDYENLTLIKVQLTRQDGSNIVDTIEVIEEVRALVTDNHDEHNANHTGMLSSPQVRGNARLVRMVGAHVKEHVWLKKYGDPDLLAASGQAPPPPSRLPVPPNIPGVNAATMAQQRNPAPNELPAGPNQPTNPLNPTAQTGSPNPQIQ